jgi:site-specific DNA-methyltransferase (adenine-specific)
MRIEERAITSIRPYGQNPRCNNQAVDAVAASIQEFGFRQPIVVDEEGTIIVGHTRYKAALKLGLKTVPVHVARGLSPAQVRAYRLADNQTSTLSGWNDDLLAQELAALHQTDFDLKLTGFGEDDLLRLLNTPAATGLTDPDDVPEPPDQATTQPGDLWLLGDHRLLCGDSSKAADVDRLLAGAAIYMMTGRPRCSMRDICPPDTSNWRSRTRSSYIVCYKAQEIERLRRLGTCSDSESDEGRLP